MKVFASGISIALMGLFATQVGAQEYALPGQVFICKSSNYQQNFCPADTRGGVSMTRQISHTACVQGQTWGYDRRGVWVNQGCEAEFIVGQPVAARIVRCESHDYRQNYCQVDTSGGVRLNQQISNSDCQRGRTWGFDRGGIWVSDGCKGDFAVGSGWEPGVAPPPPSEFVPPRVVRCESFDNRQTQCEVTAPAGIRMQRQITSYPCIEGNTWGYDRSGIWVGGNCKAEFVVVGFYR